MAGFLRGGMGLLAALSASLLAAAPAAADTLHVTSDDDLTVSSLRFAVAVANPGDTVVIDPGVNPQLGPTAQIEIDENLTIRGQGPDATSIDANSYGRAFTITAGATAVRFEHLRIEDGQADDGATGGANGGNGGSGGAIRDESAALTINDVALTDNHAGNGGDGTTTGGPGGGGGAIFSNGGDVIITRSTLNLNAAGLSGEGPTAAATGHGGHGGAVWVQGSSDLSIDGSTLAGNSSAPPRTVQVAVAAAGDGGAVYSDGDSLAVNNSTFDDNENILNNSLLAGGVGTGAAIFESSSSGGSILNATISGYQPSTLSGTPALHRDEGPVTLRNTILANSVSTTPHNCDGTGMPLTDGLHNLVFPSDPNCPATFAVGNPLLAPRADNGGPTLTRAISGGPALDAVPAADCGTAVDQRGLTRPSGAACDIGAFELQVPASPGPSVGNPASSTNPAGNTRKRKCKKKKRSALAAKKKCKKKK